jgi:hypothetical protein
MGYMKSKRKIISEEAIDDVVIAQAGNDSAWGKPMKARKAKRASLSIPFCY